MKKVLIFLFVVSYGYMFIIIMGLLAERKELAYELSNIKTQTYIQNPIESQILLKNAGYYKGDIDGIWGVETERAYGNWCAAQYIKEK